MQGYLYMLKDPSLPPGVMKVGRTVDPLRRLSEYPRGSAYMRIFGRVVDCKEAERGLIALFKRTFATFRGKEYFEGRDEDMKRAFEDFCVGNPSPMLS